MYPPEFFIANNVIPLAVQVAFAVTEPFAVNAPVVVPVSSVTSVITIEPCADGSAAVTVSGAQIRHKMARRVFFMVLLEWGICLRTYAVGGFPTSPTEEH